MLPRKAETNAVIFSAVQVSSPNVAPVTTMDSPSAMMMKPAQRSAMWPPSTAQASTVEAPKPGVQNRAAGDTYSIASATTQSDNLVCPSAKPPDIQNTADTLSQARIRIALSRASVRSRGIVASQKAV